MSEVMYDVSTTLIAAILLASMVVSIAVGHRFGRRAGPSTDVASKDHINAIQGSILGILALLLGFTFSLSLQRYDSRSEAVVDEANAIGTAYLRAQMLPAALRVDVDALLRAYVDVRVEAASVTLVDRAQREALVTKAADLQAALWAQARRAAALDPNPVTTGLYIQALNDVIDSFGRRDAALNRHVPEVVLWLVYAAFLMAGAIVGYACGIAGHRPSAVTYGMVVLIVVLVFIILDLDRPRRGLIQVSQKSLLDLQASIRAVRP